MNRSQQLGILTYFERMMIALIVLLLLFFSLEVHSKESVQKISILFSNFEPFVIENENVNAPTGLDVSIIENFSKKFNLNTEYIRSNKSLNYIFQTESAFRNFTQSQLFT